MPFETSTTLVKFARGAQLEAAQALAEMQPETPFTGLLHAYPVEAPPGFKEATEQKPRSRGPLLPMAHCPETGRPLSLHVFRDLSALILRAGKDGGLEALPATLVLPSSSYAKGFKDIPYHERDARASRLDLQARPEGIFFDLKNADATDAEISDTLSQSMVEIARQVLAAPPVADPRVHLDPPQGSRFAPHAVFPRIDRSNARLRAFNKTIAALGALRSKSRGSLSHTIHIYRKSPDEPWKQAEASEVHAMENFQHRRNARDKDLDKIIRRMLKDPEIAPPMCYRYGPEDQPLVAIMNIATPMSNHEAMAHHQVLNEAAQRHNISPLIAGHKETLDA